jgi:hypothetical protein
MTDTKFANGKNPISEMVCFVFDWDDTLLPTTYLQTKGYFGTKPQQPVSELDQQYLQILALLIELLIQTCSAWGSVQIVTNGQEGWVQDSTKQFYPQLLPLLEQIPVISARSRYEKTYPNDPWQWKYQTFLDVLAAEPDMHVIAFGDAPHDRTAMQSAILTSCSERGLTELPKVFELSSDPDIITVITQLQMIYADLLVLVYTPDAIDLYLPPLLNSDIQK